MTRTIQILVCVAPLSPPISSPAAAAVKCSAQPITDSVQRDFLTGRLLLSMLMKLADISNISRPTYLAHKWADILLVEFFNQGDQERKLGLVQTPIFDREKTSLAALQAGFISGVGVPAFAKMAAFCSDLHCLEEQLLENLNYWKRLQAEEEGKEETLSPATPSSPSNNGSTSASGGTR